MNASDRFERELTAWFVEAAAARMPDDTDAIARRAVQERQRPAWSFPGRWVEAGIERLPTARGPWRLAALLATIGLLVGLVALGTSGTRTQTEVPAPFGLADNGLVAYGRAGDIFTVDPTTGIRRAVTTGPEVDMHPRWSPDGTRLAFLRGAGRAAQLVIVDAGERGPTVVTTTMLADVDSDSLRWAPDGRSIAVAANVGGLHSIVMVDVDDGRLTTLDIDYAELEFFWRPPDGRELLFVGGFGARRGLYLLSVDDGSVRRIPMPAPQGGELRPMGWTRNGTRVAVHHLARNDTYRTFLVDVATGAEIEKDVVFGHPSNGGDRILGFVPGTQLTELCVVDVGAGPCRSIGSGPDLPDGTHFEGIRWSPDDEWVVIVPASEGTPFLIDPVRGGEARPAWIAEGADSWQRLGP